MKAQHIFFATCLAAFTLASCEKEAMPDIKNPGKNPYPELRIALVDPADEVERDNINLGKPDPVDLKNHERRGSTITKDNLEIIDYTDLRDTTILSSSVSVELQEHERRGVLSVSKRIKHIGYTNCVRPTKPTKNMGSEKVETISHY